jgi:ribosomal protein S18 acetylase RimI-like enzyme
MIIREATNKDLESLSKLGHKLSKYEAGCDSKLKIKILTVRQKKLEFTKKLKNQNTKIMVAESDNNLIGYCLGIIEKPNNFDINKIGHINSYFVDDKFRRKSVGKKLIIGMLNWFKKRRIKVVELGVLHANISKEIWKKIGFQDYYIKMRKLI